MVDFESNAGLLKKLGVKVVAVTVDPVEKTVALAEGLRLSYVETISEIDVDDVVAKTGAKQNTADERVFLHATGFIVDPEGNVVTSVYSSGPIGRFTANDVLKWVWFRQSR